MNIESNDELRARYDDLRRLVARCPDAAALIALLQRRLAANDRAREELVMEVAALEGINEQLRAEIHRAQTALRRRKLEVCDVG
ncbi:MAG: hypothetical protein Q8S73_36675 [Deltaproteobacteria bacterium]|nr:hypothetical protein [Myxococcales bacterium]MDP3219694.1 hypothetical protein [Deltaproteobacteria bacterium]